eukprot:jgi/Chrzof1/13307/Cz07g28110.t1
MTESSAAPVGSVYEQAVAVLSSCDALPAMVVVDTAGVLWPSGSKQSELCQLYEDVQPILFALKPKDIKCAVVTQADADDAHAVEAALERLKPPALGLISYQVIDSSGRPDGWLDAAKQLKGLSGTPLTDMVLFSGSLHIVRHGNRLGMSASHVRGRGLTVAQLKSSLAAFAAKKLDDRGY